MFVVHNTFLHILHIIHIAHNTFLHILHNAHPCCIVVLLGLFVWQVAAITSAYRLVVAEKSLLTSQREIVNASVGDKYPLYCSVKFYVGDMKVGHKTQCRRSAHVRRVLTLQKTLDYKM